MSEQIRTIKVSEFDSIMDNKSSYNIKDHGKDMGTYNFNSLETNAKKIHFDKRDESTNSSVGTYVFYDTDGDGNYIIKSQYQITKLATGGKRKYNKSKKSRNSKKSRKSRKSRR